jgi:hypothetical protein
MDISGANVISRLVEQAVELYQVHGPLPDEATHSIYDEIVCFDGVIREPDNSEAAYPDSAPHIDFIPRDWMRRSFRE